MTYIIPTGRVQFYHEFGLSPSHENTLYFATEQDKDDYFSSTGDCPPFLTAYAMSYTRHSRGFMRVEEDIADLIGAGYMRFKNASFENKWFYAFVRSVEYINNNCTEVSFELDVLMTWMGSFSLIPCLVERMHEPTNYIGDNLIPENLPTGEIMYGHGDRTGKLGSSRITGGWSICVATTFKLESTEGDIVITSEWQGAFYGGYYSGLYLNYFENVEDVNDFITYCYEHSPLDEGIVGIAMCPRAFKVNPGEHVVTYDYEVETRPTFTSGNAANSTSIQGYYPRNAKLYTYPYCFLSVTNTEGDWVDYKWEYFRDAKPTFTLQGVSCLETEVALIANKYETITTNPTNMNRYEAINFGKILKMRDFPMCSYVTDVYQAWLAQNKGRFISQVASTLVGGASTMATGIPTGISPAPIGYDFDEPSEAKAYADKRMTFVRDEQKQRQRTINTDLNQAGGIIGQAINMIGTISDYSRQPSQPHGSPGSSIMFDVANQCTVYKDFVFYPRMITAKFAQIIDEFFTMYGYKQMRVTTPLMNVRNNFTYVKTIGCNVSGELPADHARIIENIFDKGVRFWKDHTKIGNYVVNNEPIS